MVTKKHLVDFRFLSSNVSGVLAGGFFPPAQKVCFYESEAENGDHDVENVHEDKDGHRDEGEAWVVHEEPAVVREARVEEQTQPAVAQHVQPAEIAVQTESTRITCF